MAETGVYCRACMYRLDSETEANILGVPSNFDPHPPNREARFRAFLERDIPAHFAVCKNVNGEYHFSDTMLDSLHRGAH
ncbi:hypothetical protein BJX64DRAFT_269296 [Aspergillus heterothallicus]